MLANSQLGEAMRFLLSNDNLDMFRYDGLIPLMLATVDHKALIAPLDENDLPRALIETENDAIFSWVEAQLDEYRDASARVTVDELSR